MNFTTTPTDFESFGNDILYSFQTDTSKDVIAKVIDNATQKVIGTKRFVAVTDGVINVSPYLRAQADLVPVYGGTGFYNSPNRLFSVTVDVDGVVSQPRVFTSSAAIGARPIISSMPQKRSIAWDECDEIVIITKSSLTVTVLAFAEEATQAETYQQSGSGYAVFRINPNNFREANRIVVIVGGVDEVEYTVTQVPKRATRLAWIGSKGTVEQYTFSVEREVEVQEPSECEPLYSVKRPLKHKTILSAYESMDTIMAIAEGINSGRVWRLGCSRFIPVEVEPTKCVVKRHGALCNLEMVIVEG